MEGKNIAAKILLQLGGNQWLINTGCRATEYKERSLTLQLPANNTVANRLTITANAGGGFSLEFDYVTQIPANITPIRKFEDVPLDRLKEVFSSVTKL